MEPDSFTLFDTAIGACAIAWHDGVISAVQLAEANETATRARMGRRYPSARETAPTEPVRAAIDGITRLLAGERVDLSAVDLDMNGLPAFERAVYEAARRVPAGQVTTYGEIARRLASQGIRSPAMPTVAGAAPAGPAPAAPAPAAPAPAAPAPAAPAPVPGGTDPLGARAVGKALGANPFAIIVPCHRVVAAGGRLGGFSANGGRVTKRRLLDIEKARIGGGPDLFD